ncbi:MAG: glycosyltransferase family 4 protein [Rhizobiaceae bacterium]|nr:glycosyltransferase family 4 protein [Rhizobiaceae bacterium]
MYVVFNHIHGDSRVIKTAQAALDAGFDCVIVGVSNTGIREVTEVEGVPVIRLPNPAWRLKTQGLWEAEKDVRLLIGLFSNAVQAEAAHFLPDIVHSHDMHCISVGASLRDSMIAMGRDAVWIHDIHEYVAGLRGHTAEQYMPHCLAWERDLLPAADHLITVSDTLSETVRSRYSLEKLPTVTYNVPNYGEFRAVGPDIRSSIGLAPETPLVVFVGGASALRGCDTIIHAVAKLPNVHLAFVSRGDYAEQMRNLAHSIGLSERFHLLPYVASNEVSTFIRTADLGIHGLIHYPNAEVALPNKLFEYLHAMLPVVVSDVAAMKAFVDANGVGAIFLASDVDSCAAAISDGLANRDKLRRKITKSLRQRYSWEAQAKKLVDIYRANIGRAKVKLSPAARAEATARLSAASVLFEALYARSLLDRVSGRVAQITPDLSSQIQALALNRGIAAQPQRSWTAKRVHRLKRVTSEQGVGEAFKVVAVGVKRRLVAIFRA